MTDEQQSPQNPISEQLWAILPQLTKDQIRFVVAMQGYKTKKEAADNLGLSQDMVYRWPTIVDDAIRLMAGAELVVAAYLRRQALAKAMAVKVAGLDSDDEKIRQAVATELIEWEMGKALQKQQVTGKDGGPVEHRVDLSGLSDEELDTLEAILAHAERGRAVGEGTPGPA